MCDVGIVGGGMLGMTLALRLQQQGHRVTLIEGQSGTGGLAAPQEIGGYTWDRFYHVILLSDANLRALLEEIGLRDRLQWRQTRTGFYTEGRLYSLSNAWEFLVFPPLSLRDKARLAATILRAAWIADPGPLEAIPVTDWLRKWSGRRTCERIWLPLLRSKLGDNYRLVSGAFIWAVIARLYAARRSGLKVEMFGYVDGGYDVILQRLREVLGDWGVATLAGQPAAEVRDRAHGADVRLADGRWEAFDRVVLTLPCSRIAGLCPQLSDEERDRLGRVVYQGVLCASLLLRRPLGGYYVTNITEPDLPFTGVIEMTALVERAALGGNTLVYLPRYLTQADPYWQSSDQDVRDDFLAGLARMYPDLRSEDVVAFQVARARDVLALATLRYSDLALPPVRTTLPHVFVVNSAQIVNGTLNNNEIVGLADRKARELVPYLGTPAPATSRI